MTPRTRRYLLWALEYGPSLLIGWLHRHPGQAESEGKSLLRTPAAAGASGKGPSNQPSADPARDRAARSEPSERAPRTQAPVHAVGRSRRLGPRGRTVVLGTMITVAVMAWALRHPSRSPEG